MVSKDIIFFYLIDMPSFISVRFLIVELFFSRLSSFLLDFLLSLGFSAWGSLTLMVGKQALGCYFG